MKSLFLLFFVRFVGEEGAKRVVERLRIGFCNAHEKVLHLRCAALTSAKGAQAESGASHAAAVPHRSKSSVHESPAAMYSPAACEIVQRRYDYGRPWRVADKLKQQIDDKNAVLDKARHEAAANAEKLKAMDDHLKQLEAAIRKGLSRYARSLA